MKMDIKTIKFPCVIKTKLKVKVQKILLKYL